MKKVLIISSHFAPDAHVGAKRITKFCKYLPEYGWHPIVLTSSISDYHRLDETMMDQLPKNLKIYRVKKWHLFPQNAGREQLSSQVSSKRKNNHYNLFRKILGRILFSVEFIDYSWFFPALIQCRQIVRHHDIDVVFSSSPSPEAPVVTLFLRLNEHVSLVCDFRDPWTKAFFFDSISYFKRRVQRFLELRVLKNASRIVAAWPAMLNGKQSTDLSITIPNGYCIYNGYDPEDFLGLEKKYKRKDRMIMTFVGTFGYHVQPNFLFRALRGFLDNYPLINDRIVIRLIHEVKEWNVNIDIEKKIVDDIIKLNLLETTELIPFKSHKNALRDMLRTDVLIYIQGIDPQKPDITNGRVQAKLFEYLYAKRPILAIIPSHSEVTRIMKECNAGYIVPYGDLESATKALEQIWGDYKSGKLGAWRFNDEEIAKYDRKKQTEQLADIFNEVVSAKN